MTAVQSRHYQPSQVRGVDAEKRTVDIVASDFSLDSYGTRIDPNGWELEQFKKNGPICLQHDSYRRLPVASADGETVRVDNGQLLMRVVFPPKGTTVDADEAFGLIQAGVLKGVSVGFMPKRTEYVEEVDEAGNKRNVLIYREQRLLEVSFVTIPSNDNGLVARSREQKADEVEMVRITRSLESRMEEDKAEAEAREKVGGYKASHLVKCVDYFDKKQPANRASTKVLEKFFKLRGETPPESEVDAWTRMGELLGEEPAEEVKTEEVTEPEEKKEEETPPPEAAPTEPTPAEAPQPEQKASAPIPLSALKAMPRAVLDAAGELAAKASRKGIPEHRLWETVKPELGTLISTLSHPQS